MSNCGSKRKLCDLGTGEVVHLISYRAKEGMVDEFERIVQETAHCMYHLQAGISDVRVCHPKCGEIVFILTFLSNEDMQKFKQGPEQDAALALASVVEGGEPVYATSGCLMPAAHTLPSLLAFLKRSISGTNFACHKVGKVKEQIKNWFPRREEYEKYIHWDQQDPKKYTRNLIFANEFMDVLLMCWPPGCVSAIHSHDESSCWVALVEGEVYEVQYTMPKMDIQFIEKEMKNPTGAVGRCTRLRVIGETKLSQDTASGAYANDEIGVHRIENRSDKPAFTLYVYAPGLRKMKIFKETGQVSVFSVAQVSYMSEYGSKTGNWTTTTHPDGILDIQAWNSEQAGRPSPIPSPSSGPAAAPGLEPPPSAL
mmetsp:Transcript_17340/g.43805  ORF Transcript_17340/g.43805 Transcript_17340/m.43805 type:complete len:368 (+) Transcript_17340:245-1348(+)